MNIKNRAMYVEYGEHSFGIVCRGCCNCKKHICGGKTIYKCLAYGVTMTKNTDWNPVYNACGLFNEPWDFNKTPLIEKLKNKRKFKHLSYETQTDFLKNKNNMKRG